MSNKNQFRRGQGIIPYGIGAMVDFPEDSLMQAGLDVWPTEVASQGEIRAALIAATEIIDGRFQQQLSGLFGRRIERFLTPTEQLETGGGFSAPSNSAKTKMPMPFVRFPKWHFCPRCRSLWEVPWNTKSGDKKHLYCHSDTRLKKGSAKNCADLPQWQKPRLIPVRFAVACEAGHITDFPWVEWAHIKNPNCSAGSGKLFLVSTGAAGLAGVKVECSECHSQNNMSGSFGPSAFQKIWPNGCTGQRPWLGPNANELNCTHTPMTIQRGASNAYFAKILSSILIPPYSNLLRQVLDKPSVWTVIEALFSGATVDGDIPLAPFHAIAKNHGIDPDIFVKAAKDKYNRGNETISEAVSEQEYRQAEYDAFQGPRSPHSERHDFDAEESNIELYDTQFREKFSKVILINKLRETRVLTGFSRIKPLNSGAKLAELSVKPKNWLPAYEVRGEGIFLVFREDVINSWLSGNDEIMNRVSTVNKRISEVAKQRDMEPEHISPQFLLIHTFSHILIRQLTFDAGYDSSSLKERLYVGVDDDIKMLGLLIYTASGDSEGTLGGLVRQGEPGRLEATIDAAIKNATLCSTDPLCIESQGQGINGLNLGACHACSLLPETACEKGNTLLDRATIVGVPGETGVGFFEDIARI